MPTITDITRQRRAETRYSVYVDGRYAFALTDLELSTSGLRPGQELTSAEVERYQKQEGETKAYMAAIRYLGTRPHSKREIRDFLQRKNYTDAAVDAALERLGQLRLIDDEQFAAAWIADRQALRPRSRRRLASELASKGVSREDIQVQLEGLGEEAELQSALMVVRKKRRLPQYADPEKLFGYLMRQGYSPEISQRALHEATNDVS